MKGVFDIGRHTWRIFLKSGNSFTILAENCEMSWNKETFACTGFKFNGVPPKHANRIMYLNINQIEAVLQE